MITLLSQNFLFPYGVELRSKEAMIPSLFNPQHFPLPQRPLRLSLHSAQMEFNIRSISLFACRPLSMCARPFLVDIRNYFVFDFLGVGEPVGAVFEGAALFVADCAIDEEDG